MQVMSKLKKFQIQLDREDRGNDIEISVFLAQCFSLYLLGAVYI